MCPRSWPSGRRISPRESRATAEEILQEAFVRGLEQAAEIRDEERAVAWFYRLLRNAVIDHYRRRGAETRGLEGLAREFGDASGPAALVPTTAASTVVVV